jgi:hypothetical protein
MVVQVRVRVSDTGGDAGRTEEDTARLHAELSELDVEDVRLAPGAGPPQGARAANAVEIGGLLITAVETPVVLGQIVSLVHDWLFRNRGAYTAELVIGDDKLVVTGVSRETQERLIQEWLDARAQRQPEKAG